MVFWARINSHRSRSEMGGFCVSQPGPTALRFGRAPLLRSPSGGLLRKTEEKGEGRSAPRFCIDRGQRTLPVFYVEREGLTFCLATGTARGGVFSPGRLRRCLYLRDRAHQNWSLVHFD